MPEQQKQAKAQQKQATEILLNFRKIIQWLGLVCAFESAWIALCMATREPEAQTSITAT